MGSIPSDILPVETKSYSHFRVSPLGLSSCKWRYLRLAVVWGGDLKVLGSWIEMRGVGNVGSLG